MEKEIMDEKSWIDLLTKQLKEKVDNKEISLEEANKQLKNALSQQSEMESKK